MTIKAITIVMTASAITFEKGFFLLMIIAGVAGIVGTGLGGIIGLFFKKSSKKVISCVLNFAAGVMIAVVCFDLIPEAEALSDNKIYISMSGLVFGVFTIFALNKLLDKHTKMPKNYYSHCPDVSVDKKRLAHTGIIMVLAISLHNFPEGMAIGSTGTIREGFFKAVLIALLLALHNIPEGMAISIPLITGGIKPQKAVVLTVVAGAVTIFGAIMGYLVGGINQIATAISLALAGGAMLYITFAEILPEAMQMHKGKITAIFLISGILLGIMVIRGGGLLL